MTEPPSPPPRDGGLSGEGSDDDDAETEVLREHTDQSSSSGGSGPRGSPSTLTANSFDTGSLASTAASPSLNSAVTDRSRGSRAASGLSSLSTPTPTPSTFRLFPVIAGASGHAPPVSPARYQPPVNPPHPAARRSVPPAAAAAGVAPAPARRVSIEGAHLVESVERVSSVEEGTSTGIVRATRPRRLSHTSACENRALRGGAGPPPPTPHAPGLPTQPPPVTPPPPAEPEESQDGEEEVAEATTHGDSGGQGSSFRTPSTPTPGSLPTTTTASAPSQTSKGPAQAGCGPSAQRKKAQVAPYAHVLAAAGPDDRLAAAMSLATVALAEVANLRLKQLDAAFQQLADRSAGCLDVELLPLLIRAFGLAEPPVALVQDVLQRHGGRLTLPAVQEVCANCLTYPIEAIQRQLHFRCRRYDTAGCGLLSLAHLTELLADYGLRPAATAALAKPFIDETTGLVVYAPVLRHLVSPTHPQTYHALLRAFHLDPLTYLANFHGLPLGFREAALYRLAVADERYTLGHRLLPRLGPNGLPPTATPVATASTPSKTKGKPQRSPSMAPSSAASAARSDSVVSAAPASGTDAPDSLPPSPEQCAVLVELVSASGIPLPGLGTAVLARAVRVCLHQRRPDARLHRPQSNVLAVAAQWADTTEDEWHFDVEDSANPFVVKTDGSIPSDLRLYIEFELCTRRNPLRSNASFDLSPSRLKSLAATESEAAPCMMSCGWAELEWADVVAQAGKEKTHRLQVWGGEPGDQQLFGKEDVHVRRQGLRKIGKLFRKDTKTQLKLITRALPAAQAAQAAHLPGAVLCSVPLLPFAALYREDVAGLLRGGPAEPSQLAGILHTFPAIADDTQLFLKAFRHVWEAIQRDKAFKKRPPPEQFRHALLRLWPLLHCQLGPTHTVGSFRPDQQLAPDPALLAARQALLEAFCRQEAGPGPLAEDAAAEPFSTDELLPACGDPLVY